MPPRTDADLLGAVTLPAGALYGANTARGIDNLTVSSWPVGREREFVRALALIKKAAARFELQALAARRDECADLLHLGRTYLQDAQPMRLGQAFGGCSSLLQRQAAGLAAARAGLMALPPGGTAIGTGFGSPPGRRSTVLRHLVELAGRPFEAAGDAFDAMQNLDALARVSAELRHAATSMARIASDLILPSSGPVGGLGEIRLPAVQAGPSIMPGKVNPVVPMSLVQVGFAVVGNDATVAQVHEAGPLEINRFEPAVASRLFDSLRLMTQGARLLRTRSVAGLQADAAANLAHLGGSAALATAWVPTLGCDASSRLVKQAQAEGLPLIDLVDRLGLMSRADALEHLRLASRPVPAAR